MGRASIQILKADGQSLWGETGEVSAYDESKEVSQTHLRWP